MTPVISVVIPCWNAERWLAETLESVAVQARHGLTLETIVVDDGSTDRSVSIAERYGATIERCAHLGVSFARNAGTVRATGQYLQYLDADDVLMPATLQQRVDTLERTRSDVALTTWTRWTLQSDGQFADGTPVRRRLGHRPDVDLLTDAWWPPGAILYRRETVDRVGSWRTDLPIIQDARFLLDAALSGASFVHVDEVGLRYRVHGEDSLSRKTPEAFVADRYRSAADLHDRWLATGALDDERRAALVRVFGAIARGQFASDRAAFGMTVERIRSLDRAYLPQEPPALRPLSRLVRYEAFEPVALRWRQMKAAVRAV